ncbi:hypothetical protein CC2G_005836 [Coprinopsis cinerea AmutBmut pab1-1]|nr:hypothetical protein CC2G_005836 [Coprinopsis cinerea AmutBmut pab1-1]
MPHEERWHIAIALFLSLLTYYWMVKIFLPRSAQDNAHDSSCLPRPLPDFAIAKARARPYRPFRWNYNQTMGEWCQRKQGAMVNLELALMALDPDWWIELESTYLERIAQRKELYRMHGRAILDALPGSEEACQEVMFAAINFLTARYPSLFSFDPATGKFRNKILGKEDIVNGRDALCFLLDHVPEDFAIMQKDETTGKYHLRAGVVCSAVGWNMGEKMGMPLHEIHGEVPFYREGLQTSMDRSVVVVPITPVADGSTDTSKG